MKNIEANGSCLLWKLRAAMQCPSLGYLKYICIYKGEKVGSTINENGVD